VDAALFAGRKAFPPVGLDSVKVDAVSADDLRIPAGRNRFPVIGVTAGRIITERLEMSLMSEAGFVAADIAQDAVKCAVVARHGRNRNIGRGFVRGFGLKRGAIASSVGHDSHNITVVGVDDADMAAAVMRVVALHGGFVVVAGGEVLAELALPVAGLMSLQPFESVRDKLHALRDAARALGCTLPEPFLQVAFLPLPVIPHLKITDRGLFDVDRFAFVE
jgi:adenine deaminase